VLTITIKNTSRDSATAYLDIKYPTGVYIRSFIGPYTLNPYEDPIEITWDSSEDSAIMNPKYGINFIADVNIYGDPNDPPAHYFHITAPMIVEYDCIENCDVLEELRSNAQVYYQNINNVFKDALMDLRFFDDSQNGFLP